MFFEKLPHPSRTLFKTFDRKENRNINHTVLVIEYIPPHFFPRASLSFSVLLF